MDYKSSSCWWVFSLLVQGQILMAILPFWIAVGGDISWQELNQNPSSEVNDE
jgi:hypothetical protein